MFKDADFNKAWVSDGCADDDFEEFNGEVSPEDMTEHRIPNETDDTRIFHHYEKWEAVGYNFFGLTHKTMSKLQCEHQYRLLLQDIPKFRSTLDKVVAEWPYSCEHNLTNRSLNRIAWLGQAALAYEHQIPSIYCSGFQLLSDKEKQAANQTALDVLNEWLSARGIEPVTMEEGLQVNRQVELY